MKDYATQRSTPDFTIRNPVNGRSHLRQTKTGHPPLTGYWIDLVRFTATLISQLIIPIETVGSLSRQASSTLNTRGGGHQAIKTMERLASRTPGARNSFPPKFDHSRNGNSSSASATHPLCWQDLHHAYITTRSRYHGHRWKHNTDNPASIPVTFFICFSLLSLKNR
jgi:hypothetical protein